MRKEQYTYPETGGSEFFAEKITTEEGPIKAAHGFALTEIPQFNNSTQETGYDPQREEDFVNRLNQLAGALVTVDTEDLTQNDKLRVHTALTLGVASAGYWREEAIQELGPAVEMAKQLGSSFDPPLGPWLTTAGYYIYVDPEEPYTFTGTEDERSFIRLSREAALRYAVGVDQLVQCDLRNSPQAAITINGVSELLGDIGQIYRSFKQHVDPQLFFHYFRKLSYAHEINGIVYPSKSIATNPWARAFDTLLYGMPGQDEVYKRDTQLRLSGVSQADFQLASSMVGFDTTSLAQVLAQPSIQARFAESLGVDLADAGFNSQDFADSMSSLDPNNFDLKLLRKKVKEVAAEKVARINRNEVKRKVYEGSLMELVVAMRNLFQKTGETAAVHGGLVNTYITHQRRQGVEEKATHIGQQYGTHGLGGLPIARVQLLSAMRQHAPLLMLLEQL